MIKENNLIDEQGNHITEYICSNCCSFLGADSEDDKYRHLSTVFWKYCPFCGKLLKKEHKNET